MADHAVRAIFWSLIAHAIFVWLLSKLPSQAETSFADQPVEITVLDPSAARQKIVGETADKDDVVDQLKRQADYLSQFTKRVEKEVKARFSGATKNRPGQANTESDETRARGERGVGGDTQLERELVLPGMGPRAGSQQGATQFGKDIVVGASTVGEHIPGVKEGAFTALNTDRFTYYTFFARVNEQVRSRWIRNLRTLSESVDESLQKELAARERVSEIDIQLNKAGEFVRAVVLRSSGYKELDAAATEAFREAAPFPNPPTQMAEEDGLIHLRYGFIIQWR